MSRIDTRLAVLDLVRTLPVHEATAVLASSMALIDPHTVLSDRREGFVIVHDDLTLKGLGIDAAGDDSGPLWLVVTDRREDGSQSLCLQGEREVVMRFLVSGLPKGRWSSRPSLKDGGGDEA